MKKKISLLAIFSLLYSLGCATMEFDLIDTPEERFWISSSSEHTGTITINFNYPIFYPEFPSGTCSPQCDPCDSTAPQCVPDEECDTQDAPTVHFCLDGADVEWWKEYSHKKPGGGYYDSSYGPVKIQKALTLENVPVGAHEVSITSGTRKIRPQSETVQVKENENSIMLFDLGEAKVTSGNSESSARPSREKLKDAAKLTLGILLLVGYVFLQISLCNSCHNCCDDSDDDW